MLLFRSNYLLANATRIYSGSHFDHVGIILKNALEPDDLFMLDATSNGVLVNKWSFLRKSIGEDKFYEKVVFKKMSFKRTDDMVIKLENFMKTTMGNSYNISIEKMMRRQTMHPGRSTVEEDRDFFCSELVAKAFKIAGIMQDDEKSCTQYMPGSFSDDGCHELKLTEGVTMETDKVVIIESEKVEKEDYWEAPLN